MNSDDIKMNLLFDPKIIRSMIKSRIENLLDPDHVDYGGLIELTVGPFDKVFEIINKLNSDKVDFPIETISSFVDVDKRFLSIDIPYEFTISREICRSEFRHGVMRLLVRGELLEGTCSIEAYHVDPSTRILPYLDEDEDE